MNYSKSVLFFAVVLCLSCKPSYYVAETLEPVTLYPAKKVRLNTVTTIPADQRVLIIKRSKRSPYLKYKSDKGYGDRPKLKNKHKFSFSDGELYGYSIYNGRPTESTTRSNNYSSSKSTYSGGPVEVKGYYRKDGSYVKPYTRKPPKKKS